MSSRAAILRDAAGLREALAEIDTIKKALHGKKGFDAVKLGMMLDVARAVCLPALARMESRGSHFRLDCPGEREEFLGNFLVRKVNGEPVAEFVPRR
jgi:succinate dehydrogenase/fumarate reductase flavoprotein subunit